MVEQPLRTVRRLVTDMLGDLPPVLARHLGQQRAQVLAGLLERLRPGKTRSESSMQLGKIGRRTATLYDGSRSRPSVVIGHTMIIMGRLPT